MAQIATDGTVGRSTILSGPSVTIVHDLGTIRGQNLFHSFRTFNVEPGQIVTFAGPSATQAPITAVVGRVTGGAPSNIDGTVRSTIQQADLYLVNPAGFLFGPNARLDVPASFHASTANEVNFADGTKFSATTPNGSSLTMARPEAFGFLGGSKPGSIVVNGATLTGASGFMTSFSAGDVKIEKGAHVSAPMGTLSIAAVGDDAAPRVVAVRTGNGFLSAKSPADTGTLTVNASTIGNSSGVPGGGLAAKSTSDGSINLFANNILMKNHGLIEADNFLSAKGGDIAINGGNISIQDFSEVRTKALGTGRTGSVSLVASDALSVASNSGIHVESRARQDAGIVLLTLRARNIQLDSGGSIGMIAETDESRLREITGGSLVPIAGHIIVSAKDAVYIGSTNQNANSKVEYAGSSGEIDVMAPSITIDGGGEILLKAERFKALYLNWGMDEHYNLMGPPTGKLIVSGGIISSSSDSDLNSGGQIRIETKSLELSNGGTISTTKSAGRGSGGDISIQANDVVIASGGQILNESRSEAIGSPGQIHIFILNSINVGEDGESQKRSRISSTYASSENSIFLPTIQISALLGNVTIGSNGEISTSATCKGSAANIDIGSGRIMTNNGLITATSSGAGNAGDITIRGGPLTVSQGGRISSAVSGTGSGGSITVQSSSVDVNSGGTISSSVDTSAGGRGGTIRVTTGDMAISGAGSGIVNENAGSLPGGTLGVLARTMALRDGGRISTNTSGRGPAGNIVINRNGAAGREEDPSTLSITGNDSAITASTSGTGNAGSVTVDLGGNAILGLSAGGAINSTGSGTGDAGSILVRSGTIGLTGGGAISARNDGTGSGGRIAVAAGSLLIDHGAVTTFSSSGGGGSIEIDAGRLVRLVGGRITTEVAGGQGNAGNIRIDPPAVILQRGSVIRASAVGGNGGNIGIEARAFIASEDSIVDASSQQAVSGTVSLLAPTFDEQALATLRVPAIHSVTTDLNSACAQPGAGPWSLKARGRGGWAETAEASLSAFALYDPPASVCGPAEAGRRAEDLRLADGADSVGCPPR